MADYGKYAIYADYDFTLTDMKDELHPGNVSAVEEFIANGGHFALASGRGRLEIASISIQTNAPLILDNGATITFLKQKALFSSTVDQQQIRQACVKLYHTFSTLGITVFADHIYQPRAMDFKTRQITGDIGIDAVFGKIDQEHEIIKRLAIDGNTVITDQAAAVVNHSFTDLNAAYSAPGRIDVLKKGITKGSAVKWLKENYFKSNIKILCIGDNVNDIEMIQAADVSFAVGNAVETLKETADIVLPDCDTPCMKEIMKWIDNES